LKSQRRSTGSGIIRGLPDFQTPAQPVVTDTTGGDRLAHVHSVIVQSAKLATDIFGIMAAKPSQSQLQGGIVRFEGVLTLVIGSFAVRNCQTGWG
jgi:hypothetical protein